jgi:6-phosphogluconolactonase
MKKTIIIYGITLIMMFSTSCYCQTSRLFAVRYTETGGNGLFCFDLNREAGTFKLLSEADAGPNPSYFCIAKKSGLIYAADEVMEFKGAKGGGVTTLKYNPQSGNIEKVKELLVPDGGPCFISLSPAEDYLLMASYSSSSIAVVKLDRIVIYDFDAGSGHLKQIENGIVNFPKGTGPRHFVFNSSGTKMYVICELNSTLSVFDVDSKGGLNLIQTLTTLDEGFKGESFCADVHLGINGQYLYGSNRGENTIVVFRIATDGKLSLHGRTSCGGNWPRNFVIDPSGKYLLVGNQKSGNISLFKINAKTGIPVLSSGEYKVDAPACLKF